MSSVIAETPVQASTFQLGLLRGPVFDGVMIGGVFLLAFSAWLACQLKPEWAGIILLLDLWFLGYHHVIATYTRVAFDRLSFMEYRFYVIILPLIVLSVVVMAGLQFGTVVIATTYIYWQWYHYMRQSEGISKAYLGRCGMGAAGNRVSVRALFYAVPIAAFSTMIASRPKSFFGMPVLTPPIPDYVIHGMWGLVLVLVLWFIQENGRDVRNGKFSVAYLAYLASHFAVFILGYAMTDDLVLGWLTVNVWHNAQYLAFVWLFNVRQFEGKPDPQRRFLSWISQPGHVVAYFGVLLMLTFMLYSGINWSIASLQTYTIIPLTIVLYQTINFHHYIVDARIWKLRRAPMRSTLKLA